MKFTKILLRIFLALILLVNITAFNTPEAIAEGNEGLIQQVFECTPVGALIDLVQGKFGCNPFSWAADATFGNLIKNATGFIKDSLAYILGTLVAGILKSVLEFNSFFTDGVNTGWTITRDFTNLFFALILLLIAISTVLNIGPLDNYTAKKILPNFIIVALFINFSKAIVGFLIDISQIVMISFYNAFGDNLGDVIVRTSRMAELGVSTAIEVAIINFISIIILAVIIFILLWTILILVIRIVTLWLAIILSPLAFMSFIVPGLRSLWNQWIEMLQSALVTGPVLMFMLYLAITILSAGGYNTPDSSQNFISSGAFFNYLIVMVVLFSANMIATKAGQQGPPILQKAVGVAGTIATFGLGAYVGAGGYGTRQMLKKGVELGDKGIGGVTNVTGQNARYESFKKDLKEKQKTGVGFVGKFQGFSAEGKKEQLEDFEKDKVKRLEQSGEIYKKENARYLKMVSSLEADVAKDVKDKSSIPELGKELKKALEKGDKITARALASRVSEIKGGWEELFGGKDGKKGIFAEYAKDNPTNPAAQLDAFITKNFETKPDGTPIYALDKDGKPIDKQFTPIANNFRARQAQLLRDKGSSNFAAGLVERKPAEFTPYAKAVEKGIMGAGAEFTKNDKMFSGGGSFDFNAFYPIIQNETSFDLLAKPESWAPFNKERSVIIKELKEKLDTDPTNPDNPKIKAALKGLGASASSRVTSS